MQTVGILPILILIVAVFGFIAPNFFTESNLLNITRHVNQHCAGGGNDLHYFDRRVSILSVGSILGTTAVAAMVVSLSPEFAMLSIPAALMLGLLLGLFNGALVAFAGLPPFYQSHSAPIRRCAGQRICWRMALRLSTPTLISSG